MSKRDDPFLSCNFLLEINGIIEAGFQAISGITIETEVEKYYEGGINNTPHLLCKLTKYGDITLKRGFTQNKMIWAWYQSTILGFPVPVIGSIILLDEQRERKLTWSFIGGIVTKWEGPSFDSKSAAVAIESITIAHMGLGFGLT